MASLTRLDSLADDPEREAANRAARLRQRAGVRRLDAQSRALVDTHFQAVWSAVSGLEVRDADLMDLTQAVFLAAAVGVGADNAAFNGKRMAIIKSTTTIVKAPSGSLTSGSATIKMQAP